MINVEIGHYYEIDKGALKGTFTLIIADAGKLKIQDCKHFCMDGKSWFKFPDKEGKSKDGLKKEWFPILSCLDKEYLRDLQDSVIEALKNYKKPEVTHVPYNTTTDIEELFPSKASDLW